MKIDSTRKSLPELKLQRSSLLTRLAKKEEIQEKKITILNIKNKKLLQKSPEDKDKKKLPLSKALKPVNHILLSCEEYLQRFQKPNDPHLKESIDAEIIKQRVRGSSTVSLAAHLQRLDEIKPTVIKAFHEEYAFGIVEDSVT